LVTLCMINIEKEICLNICTLELSIFS